MGAKAILIFLVAGVVSLAVGGSANSVQPSREPAYADMTKVTVDKRVLTAEVIRPGGSHTLDLPDVPPTATAATLTVGVQFARSATDISICGGAKVTQACKEDVVLTAPVAKAAWARTTVDMTGADSQVTIYNTSASVSVTVRLNWYYLDDQAMDSPEHGESPNPAVSSPTEPPASPATPPTSVPATSASMVPTPSPSASASSTSTPSGSGTPDSTNTGVPAGTVLTVHEGDLTINTPGTVIDSMEIRGLVRIKAANVVIRNSVINGRPLTSGAALLYVDGPGYSVTVEDCEIYAKDPSYHVRGVIGHDFSLNRVDIHTVVDQVNVTGSNVTIQNSWFHGNLHYDVDPYNGNGPTHDDNIQIAGGSNIVITDNLLEGAKNASVIVTQDRGDVSNVTIDSNQLSQGACTLNFAQGPRGPIKAIHIIDNLFMHTSTYNCPIIADAGSVPNIIRSGNAWPDGATDIPVQIR